MAMALANPWLWPSGAEDQSPPQQQLHQQQQQEEGAPNRLRRTRATLGKSRRAGKQRQKKAAATTPAASAAAAQSMKPRRRHRCQWIERQVDEEFDMVLVPADGCCSESEDSDWSVGWMEPHSSDFAASDSEDSFAVIVPCYGSSSPRIVSAANPPAVWAAALLFSSTSATTANAVEQRKHVEEWLASLQQQMT